MWVGALVVIGVVVGGAGPATADPAGPTDYDTEITSVAPPVEGVELEMIGGDSFLELRNEARRLIEVVGYQGEPYLRFEVDGRVLENQRSPSRYLNDDRFGDADIPPEANADAEPAWREVASDGTYAWHDHRTHWMNPSRPPGASPGDQILEAVVPLSVDGQQVAVTVQSFWLPAPSRLPALAALVAGVALAGVVIVAMRRRAVPWSAGAVAVGVAATLGLLFGLVAHRSVPSETGPALGLWLLPALSVLAAAAALVVRRRSTLLADGLVVLAGLELAAWSWSRRDAIGAAIIPSDVPAALDRAVIVFVAVVAIGLAAGRAEALLRPPATRPTR
ncbi:MAG: hypothetical protein AAGD18_22365 [Actinomycetota bacterium]